MPTVLRFLADHWPTIVAATSILIFLWRHGKRIARIVDIAEHEFKPNGGKSMRDQTNRIERVVERVAEKQRVFTEMAVLDGVLHMDERGRVTWANSQALEMLDATEHDVEGDGWLSSIVPKERSFVLEEWRACVDQGRRFQLGVNLSRPEGGGELHEMIGFPEKDSEGRLLGFTTQIRAA